MSDDTTTAALRAILIEDNGIEDALDAWVHTGDAGTCAAHLVERLPAEILLEMRQMIEDALDADDEPDDESDGS